MENKAENLLENVRRACPNNIYAEACRIMENTKDIAPSPQGEQIKSCLEMLSANNVDTKSIMSHCTCISKEVIEEAQALYNTANGDINTFLEMLNQNQIGGGELHMQDDKIIGIYRECYCDIPMTVENMPSCYCECSAGWFEKLFSTVLCKKVVVTVVHTILSGADSCVFKIQAI